MMKAECIHDTIVDEYGKITMKVIYDISKEFNNIELVKKKNIKKIFKNNRAKQQVIFSALTAYFICARDGAFDRYSLQTVRHTSPFAVESWRSTPKSIGGKRIVFLTLRVRNLMSPSAEVIKGVIRFTRPDGVEVYSFPLERGKSFISGEVLNIRHKFRVDGRSNGPRVIFSRWKLRVAVDIRQFSVEGLGEIAY